MTQWNVTFDGPDRTRFTRRVESSTRDGAIVVARAGLHCSWTLSGAVAAMSPEEATKIAAWVAQRDAEDEELGLGYEIGRESAATFNGG